MKTSLFYTLQRCAFWLMLEAEGGRGILPKTMYAHEEGRVNKENERHLVSLRGTWFYNVRAQEDRHHKDWCCEQMSFCEALCMFFRLRA